MPYCFIHWKCRRTVFFSTVELNTGGRRTVEHAGNSLGKLFVGDEFAQIGHRSTVHCGGESPTPPQWTNPAGSRRLGP